MPLPTESGGLLALGAVGIAELDTFGDTLKARLRGPEGAVGGGGVLIRAKGPDPEILVVSDCGEANGGRGDKAGCPNVARLALGPVGAPRSEAREDCCAEDGAGCMRFDIRPCGMFGEGGMVEG